MNETQDQTGTSAGNAAAERRISVDAAPLAVVCAIVALVVAASLLPGRPGRAVDAAATETRATTEPAPVAPAVRVPPSRIVRFEPNLGQSARDVRYVARGPDFTADVYDDGLRLSQNRRGHEGVSGTSRDAGRVASARLR